MPFLEALYLIHKRLKDSRNIMIKQGLTATLLLTSLSLFSQTPDDAIRQSFQIQQGTARNMAIGGAAGSLGGDITSAYVNPAGLGFYKTGEVVLSSGWNFIGTNFNFRGTDLKDDKNAYTYGPIGLVYGWQNAYNKKKSSAFSISINQVANFNSKVHYQGLNNYSSWSEQYLEELARNRTSPYDAQFNFPFGSSLAFRTYLVDSSNVGGVFNGYFTLVDTAAGVIQENDVVTRGGIHEINLALASNSSDKFYIGGSIGIPIYSYTREQTYSETDASNNPNNDFGFFRYGEKYTSKGVGVNLRIGAIYKPADQVRVGLALQSPTFANMTDQIRSNMTTNTEGYNGTISETSDKVNDGSAGQYRYTMTTPWKAVISGSYVFHEVGDVRQQKGFITADAEYVRHQGTQYSIIEGGTTEDDNYYKAVNEVIDSRYKGTFNFRVGGEVKFTTIMARAGLAYYGNPYRDPALNDNSRTMLSTGLGYRNKGIFVDLTFIHTIAKDTNIPYYLSDKANTFAVGKNRKENVMLTVGFKF
jgi:hypothetical protein